jgi:hypothetical protein
VRRPTGGSRGCGCAEPGRTGESGPPHP